MFLTDPGNAGAQGFAWIIPAIPSAILMLLVLLAVTSLALALWFAQRSAGKRPAMFGATMRVQAGIVAAAPFASIEAGDRGEPGSTAPLVQPGDAISPGSEDVTSERVPASGQKISHPVVLRVVQPHESAAQERTLADRIKRAVKPVDLDSLLKTELPTLPGTAMRVAKLTRQINAPAQEMAGAIGCDPVLTTRILRAVNSPLYALDRRVTTLRTAVNVLGNEAIYYLVISYVASDVFSARGHQSEASRALWKHSVAVGCAAREIIRALGRAGSEEGFLCGLLHDIGKLLLLRHDPTTYEQLKQSMNEQELLAWERQAYGCTHTEVGVLAIKKWGLATEISQAVFAHHRINRGDQEAGGPNGGSTPPSFMAHALNIADELVNAAGLGVRNESLPNDSSAVSIQALGITNHQLEGAWERAEASLSDMMHLLSKVI
jgi:putative nucleotidyltransferase with HDIG domain